MMRLSLSMANALLYAKAATSALEVTIVFLNDHFQVICSLGTGPFCPCSFCNVEVCLFLVSKHALPLALPHQASE